MKIEFSVILDKLKTVELHKMIDLIEVEIIERRGKADGENAAEWWISNDLTVESCERVLKGIHDIDPEIMDSLPSPRLGGKWADEPTWEGILRDECIRFDSEMDDDGRSDLNDTYYMAFTEASQDKIVNRLVRLLRARYRS